MLANFSLRQYCNHALSKHDHLYSIAGVASTLVILLTMHYPYGKVLQINNYTLFNFIYQSALVCAFILFIYPLFKKYRNSSLDFYMRLSMTPYVLIFIPLLLVLISQFGQFQIVALLINITILTFIARWQLAIAMITLAGYAAIKFYTTFLGKDILESGVLEVSLQLKAAYILLLVMAVLIAFLRPKQAEYDLSEERVEHLSETVAEQGKQISSLSGLKRTFLMNLQHETNTPVTGIYSMSQALQDCYDKLDDKQRKDAIATIVTSSERLISYVNNLIGISKLSAPDYSLKLREVKLSNLVYECVRKCRRFYIPAEAEDDRDITVSVEPGIEIVCDEYYIKRSFENLIINAIQYCKKGKIDISLIKEGGEVKFTVRDTGIGIPQEELLTIFEPFVTSSRTTTPAGGRGVGLSLVKSVVEAHKGTITASSREAEGSVFTMTLR